MDLNQVLYETEFALDIVLLWSTTCFEDDLPMITYSHIMNPQTGYQLQSENDD